MIPGFGSKKDIRYTAIVLLIIGAFIVLILWSLATEDTSMGMGAEPIPIESSTTVAVAAAINSPAVATEQAIRVEVPEASQPASTTTTVFVPSAENNWGFPYRIMHKDFEPWDCSQWDSLLEEVGLVPLDKSRHIIWRESNCIPGVWNWHATPPNYNDESIGLFQLNTFGSSDPTKDLGLALQEMCGLNPPTMIDGKRVYLDLFWPEINIRCAGVLKAKMGWAPWGG